jgi:hypothetical protein
MVLRCGKWHINGIARALTMVYDMVYRRNAQLYVAEGYPHGLYSCFQASEDQKDANSFPCDGHSRYSKENAIVQVVWI